jgi:DNA adenine methylase
MSFTSYSERDFGKKEQEKLAVVFSNLDKKGCYVMLSNSCTPLIRKLYRDFTLKKVRANRSINCKATGRGKVDEYIILGNCLTKHLKTIERI